ncbi:MAG: nuclear transport factor 2 family protein [Aestuariibacter sp.]
MASATQAFFDTYAASLDAGDAEAVAKAYFVPTVVMNDEAKRVHTQREDIIAYITEMKEQLRSTGATNSRAEVCQTMRLSENIMFSNVKWTFKNDAGEKVFSCFISYTLQLESESLKIIVSVIDDEERELAKHL